MHDLLQMFVTLHCGFLQHIHQGDITFRLTWHEHKSTGQLWPLLHLLGATGPPRWAQTEPSLAASSSDPPALYRQVVNLVGSVSALMSA